MPLVFSARSGIYQIEIGTLDDLGYCNLHLHAIIDGPYMCQDTLSKVWHDITGDSYIVHIESCPDAHYALRYMTKHLAKMPSGLPSWQCDLINYALRGSRLVQGFFDLRHLSFPLHERVCPECGWEGRTVSTDFHSCRATAYEDFTPTTHRRPAIALEVRL